MGRMHTSQRQLAFSRYMRHGVEPDWMFVLHSCIRDLSTSECQKSRFQPFDHRNGGHTAGVSMWQHQFPAIYVCWGGMTWDR